LFWSQFSCCGNLGPSDFSGDIPPACSGHLVGCNESVYEFYNYIIISYSTMTATTSVLHIILLCILGYFLRALRIAGLIIKENNSMKNKHELVNL
jgi:hypothetical protein